MASKFLGFHSCVAEISILPGYDAASLGNWFSTFRHSTVLSTSRVGKSKEEHFLFRTFRMGHADSQLIISEFPEKSVNIILYKEKLLSVKLG
jgi:hypothetical protein